MGRRYGQTLGPAAAVVGLVAAALVPAATAAPPESCGEGAPSKAVTGTFTDDVEGSYVFVPFRVPAGTTRVNVRLCYDQPESPTSSQIRHTIDLGLYEARGRGDRLWDRDEFRGWGGSSRPDAFVTKEDATLGFLPGPIRPGRWAAELGVAAVAGQDEGDAGGDVGWRLEVLLGRSADDADGEWTPARYRTAPANTEPGWYKGDFHVHAEHSGPGDATMRETFDYAFSDDGAALDFVTLSDYVTTRHWGEIGRYQRDYPGKLIVRSAEVITYRGHVNNHASLRFADYRTGTVYRLRGEELVEMRPPVPASRIFRTIRRAGGWTQVNHPTIFDSSVPGFGNVCRGCSWDYTAEETRWGLVDALEVATGPGGTSSPEGNELGPNPFTPLAIEMWDGLRAAGYRITAVGSSDSHHAGGGNGTTQSPIGEATTVVYAEELSEEGIGAAIRAGHAYVKMFASDGPDLRFEATAEGLSAPAIMGDRVDAGAADFVAKVIGGGPAPGSQPRMLAIMRDGEQIQSVPVTSDDFTHEFRAEEPGDYRLQLMRGTAIEALTNPITLTGA
ncbi:MAG TPA: CehA/McbA family metallohydrolase [Actinomycetota bacterium]|nr:CehA/McbA family metallohydrolase [Actinomycetota bacterium]